MRFPFGLQSISRRILACTPTVSRFRRKVLMRTEEDDVRRTPLGGKLSAQVAALKRSRAELTDIRDEASSRPTKLRRTEGQHKREDMVVLYDPPRTLQETALYQKLHSMEVPPNPIIARHFRVARKLLVELGSCAADLYWRSVFLGPPEEAAIWQPKMLQIIENWNFNMPNSNPTSSGYNVTPQFTKLVEILRSCEMDNKSFRGIVIVKRLPTATMLGELLRLLEDELPHARVACIAGSLRASERTDGLVYEAFSSGKYNILVTTKWSAEDHLPSAAVTIVFNITDTLPQQITLPGLTRPSDSLLVYMIEQDNQLHRHFLQQYKDAGVENTRLDSPRIPSAQISPPPEDDTLAGQDDLPEFIEDPVTGWRIDPANALAALYLYLKESATDQGDSRLSFQLRQSGENEYACLVNFPEGSSSRQYSGPTASSPKDAKDLACFSLCFRKFRQGLLDYRCFPSAGQPIWQDNVEVEMKKANASTTTRCYPIRRPAFWLRCLKLPSNRLYPLVISVGDFRGGVHAPFVLFTRLPLPDLDPFRVFSSGSQATVRLQRGAPIDVDATKLQWLHDYTIRIARSLTNKPLQCPVDALHYLFAPIDPKWEASSATSSRNRELPRVDDFILWSQLPQAAESWATPLVPKDGSQPADEVYDDCLLHDRTVEFTNRHYVVRIRHDLSPLSPPEENSRQSGFANYVEFCESQKKGFTGLRDEHQPLVEVSPVPNPVNNLTPTSKPIANAGKTPVKYLIPELCYKHVIPASVYRTALLIPSITHMINVQLLTKEMNTSLFGGRIADQHLLSALSPISAELEQDYERLELLGDTVLKLVTSTYCFVTLPDKREGPLNTARAQMVNNKTLHQNALAAGIPPWILSKPMVAKIWLPGDEKILKENAPSDPIKQEESPTELKTRGKRQRQEEERYLQWLGDKTVADVVEALVGAAFLSGGRDEALWLMNIARIQMPRIKTWADFSRVLSPTTWQPTQHAVDVATIRAVEKIIGYTFRPQAVLATALTHSSVVHNVTTYDRLEFLGDSVLDYLVISYIYEIYPTLPPGGLSLLKSAMVSNKTIAAICALSGLHVYIQCGSRELIANIDAHAAKISELKKAEDALAKQEGRSPGQFWLDVETPKVIGDVVESIIGAMYVCDGYELHGVQRFFDKMFKPFYERHIHLHTLAQHPTKSLYELLQAEGCQQHSMRKSVLAGNVVRSEVVIHDHVVASAEDKVSALSMRKVAYAALDMLAADPSFLARTCDCRAQRSSKKARKGGQAQLGYEDPEDIAATENRTV